MRELLVGYQGVLLFAAKDANGDGQLDVAVLPKIGAPDTNPILNVLWLFPAGPGCASIGTWPAQPPG